MSTPSYERVERAANVYQLDSRRNGAEMSKRVARVISLIGGNALLLTIQIKFGWLAWFIALLYGASAAAYMALND